MKEVIGFGPASLHSTKGATGLSRTLTTSSISPLSPYQRYRGWQHEAVKPLEEFIDEAVDPRDYYLDLQEIAEGESGSVFSARLASSDKIHKLKLPPLTKARDAEERGTNKPTLVAIKNIPILPSGSPKLVDLRRELKLMKGLWNSNILGMDAVYVDLVEDSLWVRMELMERSLADVVALVPEGLVLADRMIARFANDILLALDYLRKHRIAHRDVRSDNLLLNSHGILKLADFTNAIQVPSEGSECSDVVGVVYWQAPEMRTGPYDPLKVDVWSLGATVWEMAQAEPPFSANHQLASRWPPLTNPNNFSPSFHDFLRLCSEPAATRPDAGDLMKKSFLQNVCGRPVIQQLLSRCTQIETDMQAVEDEP
ncbi:kinase-like protein [Pleurotus eryngii]|uniref:Kinase-like protein n=1 Tax=Pleurotus eryngii TaxID=5323 RepID=A0A9P6D7Y1_PLEER|nr:kinase-like protein [Pleurotus eryngii]